jgi:hypothetical protein
VNSGSPTKSSQGAPTQDGVLSWRDCDTLAESTVGSTGGGRDELLQLPMLVTACVDIDLHCAAIPGRAASWAFKHQTAKALPPADMAEFSGHSP